MTALMLAKGIGGFLAARRKAKSDAAWADYNNKMAGIQASQGQNAITTNVALNRSQHAANKVAIQTSRLVAAAKVKAGAAAAGVAGGSVNTTMFAVGRNAGKSLHAEANRFETSLLVTDQQRRKLSMSRAMAQRTTMRGPSLLASVLSTGIDILGADADKVGSSGTNLEGGDSTEKSSQWDQFKSLMLG